MKKFILLLILFSSFLFSNEMTLTLKSYATDEKLDSTTITQYRSMFKREPTITSEDFDSEKQYPKHKYKWIMLQLDQNLSSGNYWIEYRNFKFTKHTFSSHQTIDKFSFLGRDIFSFHYDKINDDREYFLKLIIPSSFYTTRASLHTAQTYSDWIDKYAIEMLIAFFLFGIIFMTAIYNGAFYVYNREKSFLYYMLMQFCMIDVLLHQTDVMEIYLMNYKGSEDLSMYFIVELTVLFILLFVRSFLETKQYLPFHDKILRFIIIITIIDLIIFFTPIILLSQVYTLIILYIIVIAWLRLRQDYQPALFFLFGWFAFLSGIFLSDNFDNSFALDPLLIGSTIEALFFSVAISYKIREIKNEKEIQRELLVHQSKLASMGEMLGNIAHQWRQPLTRLGFILMNIEEKDKQKHHEKKLKEASSQLEFMSQTINDFRSFYQPNKKKELFSLLQETEKVIELISFEKIEVELKVIKDVTILNYKNEYKQVLLNLLTNAKDVLLERKTKQPKIIIKVNATAVSVSDNGGGISTENMEKIFEPYFTTKERGMGIGLYMSKMIVEQNMDGKLEIYNNKNGAVFTLNNL